MEKIAIIGLACLFPDAQTPTAFWQNLIDQKDSTSLLTRQDLDGLDPQTFLATDGTDPDQAYSLRGGYIRDFNFEATGYHLPADLLSTLDPSVQGSLYTAKQALQDSGYLHRAANCGLILGNLAFPTRSSHQLFASIYQGTVEPIIRELLQQHPVKPEPLSPPPVSPDNAMTFGLPSMIVAQALGLTGTSFSLDAACASSLYAVELACGYLRSHKADLMLAGAVSYAEPLFTRMLFSGVQAYPKNGISRPLDSTSRGLTPSDGVGMVVLKRYADAVRDGDRIYATIRGVGLSNDGCGKHLLSPNQRGQQLAFERAYAQAGISPGEIDYLECHATGTLLGDTTELASIETFWQDQPAPLVGTAKSNVGHLLTAAGMVGLIKVILAMSKDLIPATIHVGDPVRSPNQVISAKQIVTHPTPWPRRASVKRGAISAFGFGGTNAHLILEQPLSAEQALPKATEDSSISGEHPPLQPLAIIGMDAVFGTYDGLDALERSLYEGQQSFIPLPADRWRGIDKQTDLLQAYGFEMGEAPKGAYIKSFDIDTLRYKIPPNEVNSLNP
ncbi:MAG: beta-ketoacyl synthase N-terminal-like domain-containing protein, partial [Cyanobacteria bacterium P01_D01_bin.44]